MSFDDDTLMDMHEMLFEQFGVSATVARASAEPVPVTIVVDRGIERVGEFGQVVGVMDTVSFKVDEWRPQQGDLVAWADRLGSHSKRVESLLEDDGFVAEAVLHG